MDLESVFVRKSVLFLAWWTGLFGKFREIGLMAEKKIVLSQNHLEFGTNPRFSSVFTGRIIFWYMSINLTVIKVSTVLFFESAKVKSNAK